MGVSTRSWFVASLVGAVAVFGAQGASAQVLVKSTDLDPVLKESTDLMGMIRTANLVVGQLIFLEYNGHGTMTDWENSGASEVTLDKYTLNVSLVDDASRVDFQGPSTDRTIRVVKGDRAWNETWADDGTLKTTPADNAAIRKVFMWLEPHAALQAASFAWVKRCPDGKQCNDLPQPTIAQENGKTVITTQVQGNTYKITLGPDMRPARVETQTMIGGKSMTLASNYFGYRNGQSIGKDALDKMHNGTFWPSRVTQEIDGKKVLDVIVDAGWTNPYTAYPDPESLAQAQ